MNFKNKKLSLLSTIFFSLSVFISFSTSAAFISIDDSDIDKITITAGDFERGFSVGGVLLTSGLGDSGSITLLDDELGGGFDISGSWIDLGLSDGSDLEIAFSLASAPTFVTSGIEFKSTSDGKFGTLTGTFGEFIGLPYFITTLPTLEQNGQTGTGGVPFLSVSFKSEKVPEPSTFLLISIAMMGLVRLQKKSNV